MDSQLSVALYSRAGQPAPLLITRDEARSIKASGRGYFISHGKAMRLCSGVMIAELPQAIKERALQPTGVGISCRPNAQLVEAYADGQEYAIAAIDYGWSYTHKAVASPLPWAAIAGDAGPFDYPIN